MRASIFFLEIVQKVRRFHYRSAVAKWRIHAQRSNFYANVQKSGAALEAIHRQRTARRALLAMQLALYSRHFMLRHRLLTCLESWLTASRISLELRSKAVVLRDSNQRRILSATFGVINRGNN